MLFLTAAAEAGESNVGLYLFLVGLVAMFVVTVLSAWKGGG